jgi:odorant receptor
MSTLLKFKSFLKQKFSERYNKILDSNEMSSVLFKCPSFLLNLIGCDVFHEKFSVFTKKFFITILMVIIVGYCYLYSIYHFRNDFKRMIFALTTFNFEVQAISKIHTYVLNRNSVLELINMCKKFLKQMENDRMRNCFEKWFFIAFCLSLFFVMIATLFFIFVITGPIIISWILEEKVLILGFIIPYSEKESLEGYTINYIFQVMGSILALIAFSASAIFIGIVLSHYMAFCESLEVLLDMLQSELNQKESKDYNDDEIKRILEKLINYHNFCYEFLDSFESTFQFHNLFEIGGSMFGTAVSVFAIMKVIEI